MARLNLALKFFFRSNITYAFCFTCSITLTGYFLYLKPDLFSSRIQETPEHGLCVLVPHRDVFDELLEFIPFMNEFLNRQSIKFHFIVVNHVQDGHRFNKGAILNAGYKFISEQYSDCDYIALHDIDLLPLNDNISYVYPGNDVYHVASPEYHPKGAGYNFDIYTGGVVIISNEQYRRMNGFGNHFWGWGCEDRNFFYRMSNNSISRVRPTNLTTDRSNTFKNIHSLYRVRDKMKGRNLRDLSKALRETDLESGLQDLKYELISVRSITIDEVPLTMFSLSIPCNYSETPWCKSDYLNTSDLATK